MPRELEDSVCEKAVFERIYNKYAKDLHDFLYYKFGPEFSPNDRAQDAFLKLWDNCKKVKPSKAKAFLFTVANNMMLNEAKHKKVVLKYRQSAVEKVSNESPEFVLEKKQFLERYQKTLQSLSEEQRTAFLLSKAEGKKHSEIAEMLGVSQKVVEHRIYGAFAILKKNLDGFKIK